MWNENSSRYFLLTLRLDSPMFSFISLSFNAESNDIGCYLSCQNFFGWSNNAFFVDLSVLTCLTNIKHFKNIPTQSSILLNGWPTKGVQSFFTSKNKKKVKYFRFFYCLGMLTTHVNRPFFLININIIKNT